MNDVCVCFLPCVEFVSASNSRRPTWHDMTRNERERERERKKNHTTPPSPLQRVVGVYGPFFPAHTPHDYSLSVGMSAEWLWLWVCAFTYLLPIEEQRRRRRRSRSRRWCQRCIGVASHPPSSPWNEKKTLKATTQKGVILLKQWYTMARILCHAMPCLQYSTYSFPRKSNTTPRHATEEQNQPPTS